MENPLKSVQIEVPQNVGGSFSTLRHPIHLIFDFLERLNTPLHRVKISGRSEQYPQTCARNNPNTPPHVRFLNIHLHILGNFPYILISDFF